MSPVDTSPTKVVFVLLEPRRIELPSYLFIAKMNPLADIIFLIRFLLSFNAFYLWISLE